MTNKVGGKKKKRSAKSSFQSFKREMVYKDSTMDQEYGFVEKNMGDMRCSVILPDKSSILCKICGTFKRRIWINVGDIVLISRRSFENKGDIIYKYTPEEAEHLRLIGQLPIGDEHNDTGYNEQDMIHDALSNDMNQEVGEEEYIDLRDL